MAFAPPSAALPIRRGLRVAALPQWWHLLSLDAPTVAALWSWSIARALEVHLPLSAPLLLALGTWLVYVADRILDGLFVSSPSALRERHFFYARHRSAFLLASVPVGLLLAWLIVTRMNPAARHEDIAVFGVALFYFCIVHVYGEAAERWLPKELAVGVVFAVATAVPAWSRLPKARGTGVISLPAVLTLMVLLFAMLCWLNCVAIEKWERAADGRQPNDAQLPGRSKPHWTTLWAQRYFPGVSGGLALTAVLGAVLSRMAGMPRPVPAIFLACAMTALGLAALDRWRDRLGLGAFALRIAADAVMLTPLLFGFLPR